MISYNGQSLIFFPKDKCVNACEHSIHPDCLHKLFYMKVAAWHTGGDRPDTDTVCGNLVGGSLHNFPFHANRSLLRKRLYKYNQRMAVQKL